MSAMFSICALRSASMASMIAEYFASLSPFTYASSEESVGNSRRSALRLTEESVEFATGGVEGALGVLRAVVDQGATIGMDNSAEETLGRDRSQSRVVVQVADDLAAQYPQVADVQANGLRG